MADSIETIEMFIKDPQCFDLLITDVAMPNMTGDELSSHILSIRPDMPIIMCTGFSDRINKEAVTHLGVREFFMKPLSRMEVAIVVRKVLDAC